jgi:hypothetical protein
LSRKEQRGHAPIIKEAFEKQLGRKIRKLGKLIHSGFLFQPDLNSGKKNLANMRRSAEELKQERIDAMGHDLGLLFDSIYNETVFLKFKWIEFTELYGTNGKRIDLMNRSAPWFFFIVQRVLFQDVLLGLCKLTDPAGVGKEESVSVRSLSKLIIDKELKRDVLANISSALRATEFCRDWRNRVIAHKDR